MIEAGLLLVIGAAKAEHVERLLARPEATGAALLAPQRDKARFAGRNPQVQFFVGTPSGLVHIPMIFRTGVLFFREGLDRPWGAGRVGPRDMEGPPPGHRSALHNQAVDRFGKLLLAVRKNRRGRRIAEQEGMCAEIPADWVGVGVQPV
jgi:hypothetical protein